MVQPDPPGWLLARQSLHSSEELIYLGNRILHIRLERFSSLILHCYDPLEFLNLK